MSEGLHETGARAARVDREPRGIRYDDWKRPIRRAMDVDELVWLVRAYLAQWNAPQLAQLPIEVGATALVSSADIAARAVLAARAELRFAGNPEAHDLLRQMSLTLMAAASRLGYLTTIRCIESDAPLASGAAACRTGGSVKAE